jgi:hypothetical protein
MNYANKGGQMCRENKELFIILFAFLFLSCLVGVLRAEEPEQWFLISGTELRSIWQYKETSEREKQSWQLQARLLNTEANILHQDSMNSNVQLAQAREQNRILTQLFYEYAQDQLIQVSLKNGEIAELKQTVADETLETEKYRGIAWNRLIIIIVLGAAWVVFIAFKVCRFFRII